jgi:hypothetical protein
MPKLHQYQSRVGYYVRTSIHGNVLTFQLTAQGERKLIEAGIIPDDRFPRALLLDLYRSGDAFTGGTGIGEGVAESLDQLELEFAQDPDPETAFPACDECGSLDDLHLSIVRDDGDLTGKLQCAWCRNMASQSLDTCIPTRLMSLTSLTQLFEIKEVTVKEKNLIRLEDLLRREFDSKWEELRRLRGALQQSLFESGPEGQLEFTSKKS